MTDLTTQAGQSRLQAVMFDMDGLLVDTEPLWFEVEQTIMARLGRQWTPADQQALVGGSMERSVGYLLRRAARQASPQQVADWLVGGMADLLAEHDVAAMPGAIELVAQVRAAGLPYALVTSSEREIMDLVLASLGRRGVTFPVTVCGGDVEHTKPDPEPYLLAAAKLGAEPRYSVALEDSANGSAAALAAGCVTIAVPGVAAVEPKPGLVIVTSLTEIDLDLLRRLVP